MEVGRRLVFRVHAVRRISEREFGLDDVRSVIRDGAIIESYPGDTPFPSRLILGWRGIRPVHVVVADDTEADETIVITVYEPTADLWENGFQRRKHR